MANSSASILITGESGTGKEIISRYVHRKSNRSDKPFVAVNCAAIPDNLLESELFGHEKGAFTGAQARRIGKFEEANGGTLLLDEISEMDVRLQAKLLRAIQEKEIDRLGGKSPVKVDVRILATSNRNLEAEVNAGNFREDLYFRLNVVNLDIPSLRERPDDIPVLAEFFVKKYSDANDVPVRPISPLAIQRLLSHHWRGNVRELENTMHRAVLIAGPDEIGPEAIMLSGESSTPAPAAAAPVSQAPAPSASAPAPSTTARASSAYASANAAYGAASSAYQPSAPAPAAHSPSAPANEAPSRDDDADSGDDGASDESTAGNGSVTSALVGRTVADVERDLIIDTLKHCFGNRTHAANILGISIRTLRNKLRQYTDEGLAVPAPGDGHD